jgi:SAM-dependent methyltransferase
MTLEDVGELCCPVCKLTLNDESVWKRGGISEGVLRCLECRTDYPVRNSIPRFVAPSNYADSFGFQWNQFRRTQLDSYSGTSISRARFVKETGWTRDILEGKTVLDAGCGAGRFAEIALSLGARVYAIDYSSAVDACAKNLDLYHNLRVIQADIYNLPFREESFDFVYSLGVLQHTPDPFGAVLKLARFVAPRGQLVVDFYSKSFRDALHPKYFLRPISLRIPSDKLFKFLEKSVPLLLEISNECRSVPVIGRLLSRMVPVANYTGKLVLSADQIREWALLDTFDWLSATHDHPQSPRSLRAMLSGAGLSEIQIVKIGHLVGRGWRSSTNDKDVQA